MRQVKVVWLRYSLFMRKTGAEGGIGCEPSGPSGRELEELTRKSVDEIHRNT